MHPYPESKARQKSTCDGSIDACEVRCIQGVLSQSKNLKNIKINKWTENKLIEVMSEGYSRNDEKNTHQVWKAITLQFLKLLQVYT